ncbi:hypothetical protein EDC44_1434 [Cricetibacter osteomyelitidis]|uniref:Xaa-Pro dipeptidyl-peptidase-like domain-containing protein n=1 Tax=Cricetibacter osteomyelitidis TaxID=1521931 RepID=A0A4R2SNS6_9PAST|nr:alpha/beta hydrolase [Cricetibacter osteomyelitidis]TCP90081.1 hypothetical protein EDC44_1434 [Cricetibacter osteomyelitidis]
MKIRSKLTALSSALLLASTFIGGNAMATLPQSATVIEIPAQRLEITQQWDKIFPKSDKVEHRKVTFQNRYGITLVGDLYVPKNAKGKLAAIAVSGPFGAVKEQSSGLYAQTLAERGFITLAFDPSYTGESSGLPRNVASPDINTEDFSAAVDFLANLDDVDTNNIGILGICGWGGMALNAAAADPRIKATATSTMYDMTRVMANGYNDSMSVEDRYKMRGQIAAERTQAARNGHTTLGKPEAHLPPSEALTTDTPKFVREYSDFYKTKRGFHPRSVNSNSAWTTTNAYSFANMPLLSYAQEIKNPVLIVHGENAHSRYFSEDAFKKLQGDNKELYIVPNATHVDLYDNAAGKIPFDKFEQFFKANLK